MTETIGKYTMEDEGKVYNVSNTAYISMLYNSFKSRYTYRVINRLFCNWVIAHL